MLWRKIFLALALWWQMPAWSATEHDLQFWTGTYIYGPHDATIRFYIEIQPRFGSNITQYEHILVRPAITYSLNPRTSLWLGYAWTPGFVPAYYNEQRIWQQILYRSGPTGLPWFVRFRLEQRMLDGIGTALRTRYMGRLSYPLDWASHLEAMVWSELFINHNNVDLGPQTGFDRLRVFLGGVWHFHPRMAVELGYMKQIAKIPDGLLIYHNLCAFFFINY